MLGTKSVISWTVPLKSLMETASRTTVDVCPGWSVTVGAKNGGAGGGAWMEKVEITSVREIMWVTLALLAVIVMGITFGPANWLTNRLRVDEAAAPTGGVTGSMLKAVVTSPKIGRPCRLRVTGAANPLRDVTVTPSLPEDPAGILIRDVLSEREKSGVGGGTVSSRLADRVMIVFALGVIVPTTVMLKLPERAVDPTAIPREVVAEAPVSRIDVWLRLALTPVGTPVNVRLTMPVKPFRAYSVT